MRLAVCALGIAGLLAPWAALADERPFLFATDSRTPAAGSLLGSYRITWGSSEGGAVRPIGSASLGRAGFLQEMGGEVGLTDRVALHAFGLVAESGSGDAPLLATAGGALRVRLLGRRDGPFQLTVAGGALRELGGALAVQARVVATGDIGHLRLVGDVLAERSSRAGADGVDVVVVAGASYALQPWLRAGVEYVGQDLEEALGDGAEGGARHLLGPTVAFGSSRHGLQVVGGPAFGLSATSPAVVVRAGVVYWF